MFNNPSDYFDNFVKEHQLLDVDEYLVGKDIKNKLEQWKKSMNKLMAKYNDHMALANNCKTEISVYFTSFLKARYIKLTDPIKTLTAIANRSKDVIDHLRFYLACYHFFLNGRYADDKTYIKKYKELYRGKIGKDEHENVIHTFSFYYLLNVELEDILKEIKEGEKTSKVNLLID